MFDFKKLIPHDKRQNSIFSYRFWKYLWQRMTRGFDDGDTWSLDYTIIKFTLPRLKRYREIASENGCAPSEIYEKVKEEFVKKGYKLNKHGFFEDKKVRKEFDNNCKYLWIKVLDAIIEGFEFYTEEKDECVLTSETASYNDTLNANNKEAKEIRKTFKALGYEKFDTVDNYMVMELKIQYALDLFRKYFCSLWW